MAAEADGSVQVVVRLRPLGADEPVEGAGRPFVKIEGRSTITVSAPLEDDTHVFSYEHAFAADATQSTVFKALGPGIVDSCLNGYNSSTFAYGQTGSGKTYTMLGNIATPGSHHSGFVPRLFQLLFKRIAELEAARGTDVVRFSVRCSFLEIYNEIVIDLINPADCDDSNPVATSLKIRQSDKSGTFVEGLSEECVLNVEEVLALLQRGAENRHMGATLMNRESSRSHGVLTCVVERHTKTPDGLVHVLSSRLNLIDLAGSEQLSKSRSQGDRMKEARHINQSLSALGRVIKELVEQQRSGKTRHVPYRDSKLTFLLQDSLGGNAKTTIIANVSPSPANLNETLGTLRFAQDARCLRNRPQQNRKTTGRISALQAEIERLKAELASASERHDWLTAELEAQQQLTAGQQALSSLSRELQERLDACLARASKDAALRASLLKEVEVLAAELAFMKAALATAKGEVHAKQHQLELERAAAKGLQRELEQAQQDAEAITQQLQQQRAHAAQLEQQLAAGRIAAREAAGQQQVLTQQLLAVREAAKRDTQGKQTLAIQLRATEARLAHQMQELHSMKRQLSSVEECAEAAARLARERADVLQTLHKQQQQQPAKSGAEEDAGAEVLALKMHVSELKALLAEEKRSRAAEAAAALQTCGLQEALDAAHAARDQLQKALEQERLQSKATATKLSTQVQEAQQRASAAEDQLATMQQRTQQHLLTAAAAVVGNLQQLEKAARAQAEAAEAHAAAAELAADTRAHAADGRFRAAAAAARQAAEAKDQLQAALVAMRDAGAAVQQADARAADSAARADAAEARAHSAEARAASAEAAARQQQQQLQVAQAQAAAAEVRAGTAEQKLADMRLCLGQVDSALHNMQQTSEAQGDGVLRPLSAAAELQRKVALTLAAPIELQKPAYRQRGVKLHVEPDISDDSGDSTPRHLGPRATVEAICNAFNLVQKKPFLPMSLPVNQAWSINNAPERMASSDSGDSTPRLPTTEALHELSPEVTSKFRRALENISNAQGAALPAARRQAARPPLVSPVQPKHTPPPASALRSTSSTSSSTVKHAPGALAAAGRRTSPHEQRHNLLDVFHLSRDLTRKKGSCTAPASPAVVSATVSTTPMRKK